MGNIKIFADSTCDLSPDLIKKYNIGIIPLCIVLDEKSYYDGLEITPDEIYAWSDERKTTPKTAAVTFDKTFEILLFMLEEYSREITRADLEFLELPKGVVSTLDFLISSIVKIQKGQRIALGLDDGFVEDTTPQINIIEGVNESRI